MLPGARNSSRKGEKIGVRISSGGNVDAWAVRVPLDEWTHVAVSYDQAALRLTINGKLVASAGVECEWPFAGWPLTVGNYFRGTIGFAGLIDDVRIRNHAGD